MSEHYIVTAILDEGIARTTHPTFGTQRWVLGRVRGRDKLCIACKRTLHSGVSAYRPTTNDPNRMHRLCKPCVHKPANIERRP